VTQITGNIRWTSQSYKRNINVISRKKY